MVSKSGRLPTTMITFPPSSKGCSSKKMSPSAGAGISLICVVEGVVHEARDERGLAHRLLAQEHQLELPQRVAEVPGGRHGCRSMHSRDSVSHAAIFTL